MVNAAMAVHMHIESDQKTDIWDIPLVANGVAVLTGLLAGLGTYVHDGGDVIVSLVSGLGLGLLIRTILWWRIGRRLADILSVFR